MTITQMLLVEDDTAMRQMLESLFSDEGFAVSGAASAGDALDLARDCDFDVVLSDIRMPGGSGIDLVEELRALRPTTPVVLMTAFGTPDTEVDALRAGAFDYTPKPFEPGDVVRTVRRAVDRRQVEVRARQQRTERSEASMDLVARSESMHAIASLLRRAGRVETNALVIGELGTGKEIVARTLHARSGRAGKRFLRVACDGDPAQLERDLFGGDGPSERSAFERADGGTLFLDGVGELPLAIQAKLVHVFQERAVRIGGSERSVAVDVRVVASTDRDLDVEVEAGRFREDLYYRLNVIPIRLRPLRERPEDIGGLVECFARRHSGGRERRFSQAAIRRLQAQPWRGNARELENVVQRAITLADGEVIEADGLPLDEAIDPSAVSSALLLGLSEAARAGYTLRQVEDRYIAQMLAQTGGRKGAAAQRLGIDRKTLYRRDLSR